MQVNEIFKSIQGEGPNFGKPAIFLRTAQCNLKCTWCDTKYTWDWKNYDFSKEVKEMTIDEVKDAITELEIKHLVITGGEPLLQQDDLADFPVKTTTMACKIASRWRKQPPNNIPGQSW